MVNRTGHDAHPQPTWSLTLPYWAAPAAVSRRRLPTVVALAKGRLRRRRPTLGSRPKPAR
jgi:hypothetical protein